MEIFWQIFAVLVFITGLLDSHKYRDLTRKIKRYNTSRGISRTFINKAFLYKIVVLVWAIFYLKDWAISLSSLYALYTIVELFWNTYLNYPYKCKNLKGFKRPNLVKYIWNSILPNKIAGRL